nr:nuclear protein [Cryptococcus depauperatus CBS 7855]
MAALQHTISSAEIMAEDSDEPAPLEVQFNRKGEEEEAADQIVLDSANEEYETEEELRQMQIQALKQQHGKEKERKRVKVYELRDTSWFDRGTGFCKGFVEDDGVACLQVEAEDPVQEDPDEPGGFMARDFLLNTPVEKDDIYGKQQDTLIVWTDPKTGVDIALSFQDAEGCEDTWNFICDVQKHLLSLATPSSSSPHASPAFTPTNPTSLRWQPPSLSNIRDQEYSLRFSAKTAQGRERCIEHILNEDYIKRLTVIFEQAEDLESIDDLHALCSLMQTILLFNDNGIFEYILQEDVFQGVIGMLEYDPEHPDYKANFRAHFLESSQYRSVVPIPEPLILHKIHQTYRLLFLKDIVLARMIDDPAFNILNGFVFFNQVDILNYIQGTEGILENLFGPFREPLPLPPAEGEQLPNLNEKKRDIIFFLHSLCTTAKSIQLVPRINLYRNLIERGLISPIKYALRRPEARILHAGAEMLTLVVEHDANSVKVQIFKEEERKERTVVQEIVSVLQSTGNGGLMGQMGDTLRTLLEGPVDTETFIGKKEAPVTETFNTYFYENIALSLFRPLLEIADFKENHLSREYMTLIQTLVELLSYCVIHHQHKSSYFILSNPISKRIAGLLYVRDKPLRHAALRFLRACLKTPNHFIHRHFVKNDLLEPLVILLEEEGIRDNMMSSACMEVVEQIRKDNIKSIINYLFDSYSPRLEALSHRPLLRPIIMGIRSRWEINNEPAPSVLLVANTSMTETEGWGGERREEEWFEESDEEITQEAEEDGESIPSKRKRSGETGGPKKRSAPRSTETTSALGLDYNDPESPLSHDDSSLEDPLPNSTTSLTTTTSLLDRTVKRAEEKEKEKDRQRVRGLEEGLGDVQAKMREKRRREEEEDEGFAGLLAGTKPLPVATVAASAASGGGTIEAGKRGDDINDERAESIITPSITGNTLTDTRSQTDHISPAEGRKAGGLKEAGKKIRLNFLGKKLGK